MVSMAMTVTSRVPKCASASSRSACLSLLYKSPVPFGSGVHARYVCSLPPKLQCNQSKVNSNGQSRRFFIAPPTSGILYHRLIRWSNFMTEQDANQSGLSETRSVWKSPNSSDTENSSPKQHLTYAAFERILKTYWENWWIE